MSRVRVKCPTCKRELDWETTLSRPFCSERCRLVDLGAWLTEQRGIPGEGHDAAGDAPSHPSDEDSH